MINKRIIITLPVYVKNKVEQLSEKYGCSKAEIFRLAILKFEEREK